MNQGFIALISTIIISAMLLLIAPSVSHRLLSTRFILSYVEQKEISRARARSCIEELYGIFLDNSVASISVPWSGTGTHECTVTDIQKNGNQIRAVSESVFNSFTTKVMVTFIIQNQTVSVGAWDET